LSILIKENTIAWNFIRKFSYGDNFEIDFSTDVDFFKFNNDVNLQKDSLNFELSKEAINLLTICFKNYAVIKPNLLLNKISENGNENENIKGKKIFLYFFI